MYGARIAALDYGLSEENGARGFPHDMGGDGGEKKQFRATEEKSGWEQKVLGGPVHA